MFQQVSAVQSLYTSTMTKRKPLSMDTLKRLDHDQA